MRLGWLVKRILSAIGIFLVSVLLGFIGLYLFIDSEAGRERLSRLVSEISGDENFIIAIGSIDKGLPSRIHIQNLTIADSKGEWLRIDKLNIDWEPSALLGFNLHISNITLHNGVLTRMPFGKSDSDTPTSLPTFPFSVTLENILVDQFILKEPVLGETMEFHAEGSVKTDEIGKIEGQFFAERTDANASVLALNGMFSPDDQTLLINADLNIPPHSPLLKTSGLAGLEVSLSGFGPVDNWKGDLVASSGGVVDLHSEISVYRNKSGFRAVVNGATDLNHLVSGPLDELLAQRIEFALDLQSSNGTSFTVQQASISSEAVAIVLQGSFTNKALNLDSQIEFSDQGVSWINRQLQGSTIGGFTADANISGSMLNPDITIKARPDRIVLRNSSEPLLFINNMDINAAVSFDQSLDQSLGQSLDQGMIFDVLGSSVFEIMDATDGNALGGLSVPIEVEFETRYFGDSGNLKISTILAYNEWVMVQIRGEIATRRNIDRLQTGAQSLNLDVVANIPTLSTLDSMLGPNINGEFQVHTLIESEDYKQGVSIVVEGILDKFSTGMDDVDAVLGETIEIQGVVFAQSSGDIKVNDLAVMGNHITVTGSMDLNKETNNLRADYRLDLSKLSNLVNMSENVSGHAVVTGSIIGPLFNPIVSGTARIQEFVIAEHESAEILADFEVEEVSTGPVGNFSVSTQHSKFGNVMLSSKFSLPNFEKLSLRGFRLQALDSELSGDVETPLDLSSIHGEFVGRIPDLGLFGSLAGLGLKGSSDFSILIDENNGVQTIEGLAKIDAMEFISDDSQPIEAKSATIQLNITNPLGNPKGAISLVAEDALVRGIAVSKVKVDIEPENASKAKVRLSMDGVQPEPFSLVSSGTLSVNQNSVRAVVDELGGMTSQHQMHLRTPAIFEFHSNGFQISDLSMNLSGGELEADMRFDGETMDAVVDIHKVPLSLIGIIQKNAQIGGSLSGKLSIGGNRGSPVGVANLQLENLQQQADADKNLPELFSELTASWKENQFTLDGVLTVGDQINMEIVANAPLILPPESLIPEIPKFAQIMARAKGQIELDLLQKVFPLNKYSIAGSSDIDVEISGSINSPLVVGTLELQEGKFESFPTATLVDDLSFAMDYREEIINLTGAASDGSSGSLTFSGTIDPDPKRNLPFELDIEMQSMAVLGRDDLTAIASGSINISGVPEKVEIAGEVTMDTVEVYIADSGGVNVVELEVTEINRDEESEPNTKTNQKPKVASNVGLALDLFLPRRVFVRGNGLDSEWQGHFTVSGALDSPVVTGDLKPIRGGYTLLGRQFELKTGSVNFHSDQMLDPSIYLPFEFNDPDITAVLSISGTASRPEIELTSRPSLPTSEIISRVLFGKDSQNLSSSQQLELASIVVSLRGGGRLSVIENVRTKLGVDVLTFDEGKDDTTTVKAGKYVTERVYLEVERGADEDDNSATIEYELTPQVKLQTESRGTGEGRVGIEWHRDY